MAHTPGPWTAGDARIIASRRVFMPNDCVEIRAQEGGLIACLYAENWTEPGMDEANARLIAAAPDLLEALKGVLRVADRKTDEFDAAHAAISKAEGRQ